MANSRVLPLHRRCGLKRLKLCQESFLNIVWQLGRHEANSSVMA
ncbi:hypothetical protein NC652_015484 [Populus alba x Populus x berolinensis]|uniref:Uncharacterized protein n=1 Tax=Populus alba x Populus x berolinensis TaxID=444605 RepID=A0AAD6QKK9_9ROSI|nr:hypothetical protein NC651_014924 [Populus alba x Populus x berolinensis]KAJ6921579.1 hypothetical protein NC652_015484 [Populus alba x Populus x berolinensis]KAJ6992045.1 hypothetical protein NC653_015409 [Populus alba x Populus x berolinensis]